LESSDRGVGRTCATVAWNRAVRPRGGSELFAAAEIAMAKMRC